MPNQSNIQQTILNGKYSLAILVNNNLTLVSNGGLAIKECFIDFYNLTLQALINQYAIGDYISSTTTTLYDRINSFVGIPYGAVVDPNFQNPGIIIDVITAGSKINTTTIIFSNQTAITLSAYQATYFALYGNTPYVQIFVAIYDNLGNIINYAPDEGTAPLYTYTTPGDPASGIASIAWGYGVATTGYVLLSGVMP